MSKIPMFPNKFAILASILGGLIDTIPFKTFRAVDAVDNLNNFATNSTVYVWNTSKPINAPNETNCSMICIKLLRDTDNYVQIVFKRDSDIKIYVRYGEKGGSWGNWKTISMP